MRELPTVPRTGGVARRSSNRTERQSACSAGLPRGGGAPEHRSDLRQAALWTAREFTLRDAVDRPPPAAQRASHANVPTPVVADLLGPRTGVRLRSDVSTTIVPVPETSVDKNRNLRRSPHEIGSSTERLVSSPSTQPSEPEKPCELRLCRRVPPASHPRHQLRPRQSAEGRAFLRRVSRPTAHFAACSCSRFCRAA